MKPIYAICTSIFKSSPLQVACSFGVGVVMYLVGVNNWEALQALFILCFIDWVLALYTLRTKKRYIGSKKIADKAGHFVFYTIGIIAMNMLNTVSQRFGFFTNTIIVVFSFREAWSILEHLSELGYKIPVKFLQDIKKEISS